MDYRKELSKKIYHVKIKSINAAISTKNRSAARKTVIGLVILSITFVGNFSWPAPTICAANSAAWQLAWSDEFNGPDGSAVDSTKWTFDVGGKGWGNNELETYTSRTANAHVENGSLVINAIKETFTRADNTTRNYTSARLLTKHKFSQTYGRFEARIKGPFGQSILPA